MDPRRQNEAVRRARVRNDAQRRSVKRERKPEDNRIRRKIRYLPKAIAPNTFSLYKNSELGRIIERLLLDLRETLSQIDGVNIEEMRKVFWQESVPTFENPQFLLHPFNTSIVNIFLVESVLECIHEKVIPTVDGGREVSVGGAMATAIGETVKGLFGFDAVSTRMKLIKAKHNESRIDKIEKENKKIILLSASYDINQIDEGTCDEYFFLRKEVVDIPGQVKKEVYCLLCLEKRKIKTDEKNEAGEAILREVTQVVAKLPLHQDYYLQFKDALPRLDEMDAASVGKSVQAAPSSTSGLVRLESSWEDRQNLLDCFRLHHSQLPATIDLVVRMARLLDSIDPELSLRHLLSFFNPANFNMFDLQSGATGLLAMIAAWVAKYGTGGLKQAAPGERPYQCQATLTGDMPKLSFKKCDQGESIYIISEDSIIRTHQDFISVFAIRDAFPILNQEDANAEGIIEFKKNGDKSVRYVQSYVIKETENDDPAKEESDDGAGPAPVFDSDASDDTAFSPETSAVYRVHWKITGDSISFFSDKEGKPGEPLESFLQRQDTHDGSYYVCTMQDGSTLLFEDVVDCRKDKTSGKTGAFFQGKSIVLNDEEIRSVIYKENHKDRDHIFAFNNDKKSFSFDVDGGSVAQSLACIELPTGNGFGQSGLCRIALNKNGSVAIHSWNKLEKEESPSGSSKDYAIIFRDALPVEKKEPDFSLIIDPDGTIYFSVKQNGIAYRIPFFEGEEEDFFWSKDTVGLYRKIIEFIYETNRTFKIAGKNKTFKFDIEELFAAIFPDTRKIGKKAAFVLAHLLFSTHRWPSEVNAPRSPFLPKGESPAMSLGNYGKYIAILDYLGEVVDHSFDHLKRQSFDERNLSGEQVSSIQGELHNLLTHQSKICAARAAFAEEDRVQQGSPNKWKVLSKLDYLDQPTRLEKVDERFVQQFFWELCFGNESLALVFEDHLRAYRAACDEIHKQVECRIPHYVKQIERHIRFLEERLPSILRNPSLLEKEYLQVNQLIATLALLRDIPVVSQGKNDIRHEKECVPFLIQEEDRLINSLLSLSDKMTSGRKNHKDVIRECRMRNARLEGLSCFLQNIYRRDEILSAYIQEKNTLCDSDAAYHRAIIQFCEAFKKNIHEVKKGEYLSPDDLIRYMESLKLRHFQDNRFYNRLQQQQSLKTYLSLKNSYTTRPGKNTFSTFREGITSFLDREILESNSAIQECTRTKSALEKFSQQKNEAFSFASKYKAMESKERLEFVLIEAEAMAEEIKRNESVGAEEIRRNESVGAEEIKRNEASVRMQRVFRGYRGRRAVSQTKAEREKASREKAAVEMQRIFRGYQVKKLLKLKKQDEEDMLGSKKKEGSAIKIQRIFRAHQRKKALAEARVNRLKELKEPASSIKSRLVTLGLPRKDALAFFGTAMAQLETPDEVRQLASPVPSSPQKMPIKPDRVKRKFNGSQKSPAPVQTPVVEQQAKETLTPKTPKRYQDALRRHLLRIDLYLGDIRSSNFEEAMHYLNEQCQLAKDDLKEAYPEKIELHPLAIRAIDLFHSKYAEIIFLRKSLYDIENIRDEINVALNDSGAEKARLEEKMRVERERADQLAKELARAKEKKENIIAESLSEIEELRDSERKHSAQLDLALQQKKNECEVLSRELRTVRQTLATPAPSSLFSGTATISVAPKQPIENKTENPHEVFQRHLQQLRGETLGALAAQFAEMESRLVSQVESAPLAKLGRCLAAQDNVDRFYHRANHLIASLFEARSATPKSKSQEEKKLIVAAGEFEKFSNTLPGCPSQLVRRICYGVLTVGVSSFAFGVVLCASPALLAATAATVSLTPLLTLLLFGSVSGTLPTASILGITLFNQPAGVSKLGHDVAKRVKQLQ
jgi:hypothetical protein